jgi:alpha-N-acetylglucosamine transferase
VTQRKDNNRALSVRATMVFDKVCFLAGDVFVVKSYDKASTTQTFELFDSQADEYGRNENRLIYANNARHPTHCEGDG